jgi:hypothetical protein
VKLFVVSWGVAEKRGPGQPAMRPEKRKRVHGIALRPTAIEHLQSLAAESDEAQGELVDRLLEKEERPRQRRGR